MNPTNTDQPTWHHLSSDAACEQLSCDPTRGLSADEVAKRLAQHGSNTLPEDKKKPWWRVFLRQFASPLIYILLAAALLAFVLGKREDALVILIVVLVNSIIGSTRDTSEKHSAMTTTRVQGA